MAPWDGSENYQPPPGTDGIPDTTIESSKYNTFIHDLVNNDLNKARPITRGGTGATTAVAALTALGGEKAQQVIANYDAATWISGSFYSAAGATSAPVAGHRFLGLVTVQDANNIVLEAFDLDSTPPGDMYTRVKKDGAWANGGAWGVGFVKKTGDTMTGPLMLSYASPIVQLDKSASGQTAWLAGSMAGKTRWIVEYGNAEVEDGVPGNAGGSNFAINRYKNDGTYLGTPFTINRATGAFAFYADGSIAGALSVAGNLAVTGAAGGISVNSRAGGKAWTFYDPDGNGLQLDLSAVGTVLIVAPTAFVTTGLAWRQNNAATAIVLNSTPSGGNGAINQIIARRNDVARWDVFFGEGAAETGQSAGSNFQLRSFSDAGALMRNELTILRTNGNWYAPAQQFNFGPGGAANAFADLLLNGGEGAAGGPAFVLTRNGGAKWYIATRSRIYGDNTNDLTIWSPVSGVEALRINVTNGYTTLTGDLTVTRNNNIGLIWFGNGNASGIYGDGSNYFCLVGGNWQTMWHANNFNPAYYVTQNRTANVGDTGAIAGHNEPAAAYFIGGMNVTGTGGGVNAFRWKITQYYTAASGWVTAPGV